MKSMTSRAACAWAVALLLPGVASSCSDASERAKDAGTLGSDAKTPIADGPSPSDVLRPDNLFSAADAGSVKLDGKLDVETVSGDAAREAALRDGAANDGTGATCVGPDNTAPEIAEIVVPDPPPAPKGGTIEPGLYYETSWIRYSGIATPPDAGRSTMHRQTTTIDSGLEMVISTRTWDARDPMVYVVRLWHSSPTTLQFYYTCPNVLISTGIGYDATPGSVTFYHEDTIGPYSWTLTKQ